VVSISELMSDRCVHIWGAECFSRQTVVWPNRGKSQPCAGPISSVHFSRFTKLYSTVTCTQQTPDNSSHLCRCKRNAVQELLL